LAFLGFLCLTDKGESFLPRLDEAVDGALQKSSISPALGSGAPPGVNPPMPSKSRSQYLEPPPYNSDGSNDAGSRQGALQDMDLHCFHPVSSLPRADGM
jgi:hypothetical protein